MEGEYELFEYKKNFGVPDLRERASLGAGMALSNT